MALTSGFPLPLDSGEPVLVSNASRGFCRFGDGLLLTALPLALTTALPVGGTGGSNPGAGSTSNPFGLSPRASSSSPMRSPATSAVGRAKRPCARSPPEIGLLRDMCSCEGRCYVALTGTTRAGQGHTQGGSDNPQSPGPPIVRPPSGTTRCQRPLAHAHLRAVRAARSCRRGGGGDGRSCAIGGRLPSLRRGTS